MRILDQRIYIVTSPALAAAVQRASKTLSFTPIIPEVTRPVLGLDDATMAIVRSNLDPGPDDEQGYLSEIQGMVYTSLGPGTYLNELTLDAVRKLGAEVAAYAASLWPRGTNAPTDLLLWIRHIVTVATANYLYGPENPIALHPELEEAFWDFDHGLAALLIGVYPSLTARKAYTGRERLAAALADYLEAGRHKTGSKIIQKRVELALKYGWSLRMTARSELSFLFAATVNTTTATFWILLRLYADKALLEAVRGEVAAATEPGEEQDHGCGMGGRNKLRIPTLGDQCPTLTAVYNECLRLGSDNFSNRKVREDTVLADRYLLRKGAIVQIAGGVIHADEAVWGDDATAFNPRRFLGGTSKGQRHPAAFRAFGGGKTLCPGRHFARNEILAFAALVVTRFDVDAPHGGAIEVPEKKDTGLPVHILEPTEPVSVVISKRVEGAIDIGDVEFTMEPSNSEKS
ncbi:hypothetical protein DL765_003122 [Monosporascus sp. GIB2]|nr:hypothetical protein DL765_003122 [Monosporascus sp. GIB2]